MAVIREVGEESGVRVREVTYLGSQPWPFPSSLMLGYRAVADDPSTTKADGVEISELRWFTRPELLASIEAADVLLPPRVSIARRLIESWYGSALPDAPTAW
jgi:NAD+ diphosphatase